MRTKNCSKILFFAKSSLYPVLNEIHVHYISQGTKALYLQEGRKYVKQYRKCFFSLETPSTEMSSTLTSSVNSFELFSSSQSSSVGNTHAGSPPIRRGPGRPRLKPSGPANTGSRGTYRPRKPARPLPVPLPSDGSTSGSGPNSGSTPSYSNYLYNFTENDA